MQIRPTTTPLIQTAGPRDHAQEGPKPAGGRIVLEQAPGPISGQVATMAEHAAEAESMARSGETGSARGPEEGPNNGQVRKHLAGIDKAIRRRLMAFGEEQGLDSKQLKALSQEFHQGIREAYESFKSGDIGDKNALMLEVRHAFETMREGFRAQFPGENAAPEGAAQVAAPAGAVAGGALVPEPDGMPMPTVDPVGAAEPGQVVDTAQVDEPRGEVSRAIDSLLSRFQSRMNLLEQLFSGERDSQRGVYDATGRVAGASISGERFDTTA